MADDINRQHIYNIMDWLEEEQEKDKDSFGGIVDDE